MRDDPPNGLDEARACFERCFRELAPRVFAYARRQCEADEAQDVVSDTFLVAWRRWGDVPDNALPWLLVTARNTIANRRRGTVRRDRLTEDIRRIEATAGNSPGADHDVIERAAVLGALAQLTYHEREALLLVAWDGLSSFEAAKVAGCTRRAFEVRLSRARARLTRELRTPPDDDDDFAALVPDRNPATRRKAT